MREDSIVSVVVKGLSATFSTAVITLSLALAAGCARRGAEQPPEPEPTQATAVPLPEWAPEDPSPEFLRAARVLRPVSPEVAQRESQGDPAAEAWWERYRSTYPAAYELFGTLSDEQVERFLSGGEKRKKLLIPVRSLTAKQRAALDNWIEVRREAMKGVGPEEEDFLVKLFKLGARDDLSNVEVGFTAGGRVVHVLFCVTRSDGSTNGVCASFAML